MCSQGVTRASARAGPAEARRRRSGWAWRPPPPSRGTMEGVLNSDMSSTSTSGDSTGGAVPTGRRSGTGPYLDEVTGRGGSHTPVWFMRQAGRSLPEYKKVRGSSPMLQACFDPAMPCEITLQPVHRHGVDAAIFFSDIVIPLAAAGVDIDIVPGVGPVVAEPIRDEAGIAAF